MNIDSSVNIECRGKKKKKSEVLQGNVHVRKERKEKKFRVKICLVNSVRLISPYLIKAVYFFCRVNRFIASSTGWIHDGAAREVPRSSAKLGKKPFSSSPSGISVNIRTGPPGEEESSEEKGEKEPYGTFMTAVS